MTAPATSGQLDLLARQFDLLRFSEELQGVLARCSDESAVWSAAVHRTVATLAARGGALALYDAVSGRFDVVSHTRGWAEWPVPLFARALAEGRTVTGDGLIAVPVAWASHPCGVLALARPEPMIRYERQAMRSVAGKIGSELERRRDLALDDVLDALLRKTKPIDVYTHAVRELRRFVRYDHSAAIMTATRELHQIWVRVEKVVMAKGGGETLLDSTRQSGAFEGLQLTAEQYATLRTLEGPIHAVRYAGGEWRTLSGHEIASNGPEALALCDMAALGAQPPFLAPEGSLLLWPLAFGGQMLGVLRLSALRPGAFEPLGPYSRALDRFARLLSVTIYRSDLYYQSERQLQAIQEMGRLATHPQPAEEVCAHALRLALHALHVEIGTVLLRMDDGALAAVAQQGVSPERTGPPGSAPVLGLRVAQTGRAVALQDVRKETGYVALDRRVRSELAVPITYDDTEVLGVISVQSFEENRFREEDEEVISFLEALANQTAVALKNSGLRAVALERFGLRAAADTALTNADFYQRILAEDQQRRARQEAQQELSRRLMRSERVQDILQDVVSLSLEHAGGDGACLYLVEHGVPTLQAHAPLPRRGATQCWLHQYRLGQETLDKVASTYTDAGADHAWVLHLEPGAGDAASLPICDAVVAPLYGRSRTRGLLCVLRNCSSLRPPPGQNEAELLATVAGLASVALEKLRQREQMRALHAIDRLIGAGHLPGPVFSRVLDGVVLTSPGDGTGYLALAQGLFDPASPALYRADLGLRVHLNREEYGQVTAALQVMQQIGHAAIRGGIRRRRELRLPEEAQSVLAAPLLKGESVHGALVFWHPRSYAFTEDDEDWVRLLATEAAIAIEAWERTTHLQRSTEQLRLANQQLAEASKAKSEFLANMSHELRTPLNAVIGFSSLLLDPRTAATLSEEERVQSLVDIRDSGHHLLALINDILDLSKVEAGRMVLAPEEFSLVAMIDGVRTVGETLAAQQGKQLHVQTVVEPPLDRVTADPGRVRQVLYNLVSNAVKFTPDGGAVTIGAHAEDNRIVVQVHDTGIGIASQDQERIFEAFQQIDSSSARAYPGTGLGLALVRTLVQLQGGRVYVESAPGEGSTFTFTLPR
jgi:signal transduction histidine kinase